MYMADERLYHEIWDTLTPREREIVALAVSRQLPAPFRLLGLKWYEMGDQRHQMGLYDYEGARFALIPGGTVTLGYDRNNPFIPNEEQQQDWDWTREEWGLGPLNEYLDQYMTPLRSATIEPFLIEVSAQEMGLT